ncbi:hypothetical protein N7454_000744 [Penicillium verhagenii]|nr:hypothetical protein N7454_000744 [Penicillium verhagenii]
MLSWVYPIRIVQAILALATIGLTAYVIGTLYDQWSFSNVTYFMLFNGCWTAVVAVPYLGLAPVWLPRFSHEVVIPAIELLTMGLWLSGWIALAVMIPHPSSCSWSSCYALQAQIVIAAVEWALFVFTNAFAIMDVKNSRNTYRAREPREEIRQEEQPEVSQAAAVESV